MRELKMDYLLHQNLSDDASESNPPLLAHSYGYLIFEGEREVWAGFGSGQSGRWLDWALKQLSHYYNSLGISY